MVQVEYQLNKGQHDSINKHSFITIITFFQLNFPSYFPFVIRSGSVTSQSLRFTVEWDMKLTKI